MNITENITAIRRSVRSFMLKHACNMTLTGLERFANALPK